MHGRQNLPTTELKVNLIILYTIIYIFKFKLYKKEPAMT